MGVRERRREALIAAAYELFLDRGVDRVTIDDIADRCDVTRRTVYRYFATREQVALAVEVRILQRWGRLLHDLGTGWQGTGADRLRAALADVEQLVDDAADEVRFTRVFDAEPAGDDDSDLGGQFRAAVHHLLAPIVAILRDGSRDGTLILTSSPELTASTLTNAYLGLAQRVYGLGDRLAEEQGIEPRRMLTELARLFVTGLSAGGGHTAPHRRDGSDDQ
ncbi:TetR/AcrR family transcriptional regulator [Actinoplanes flavus]|uniref:TetR/AcrR family transcriptional regulator n=1 Tax=Actinoplanes flavus TaxID=2820290 RepID=A0ABS3UY11_9ACTN|nr:TetR/AcrR family transcriptional regulator [Actinoplanes flavus]MBO3743463.1 TetR/AcrR family transcriptional regulator [Actinoplanes flavus]